MKVQREGELKPEGWSIGWGRHPQPVGFKFGIWGGTLSIPHEGFREWFFRIPFVSLVIVLTWVSSSDG